MVLGMVDDDHRIRTSLLLATPFAAPVRFLAETGSTMDEAKSLVAAGALPGTVIVTDRQTAGRGRLPGRSWLDEPGQSLLATLILDANTASLPALPLRVGLALARACEDLAEEDGWSTRVELKWPNDLLVASRKLGGILCEATSTGLFIGFGLNVGQRGFPPGLAATATSLALARATGRHGGDLAGPPPDRFRLLELCLGRISEVLVDEGWREAVETRLWRLREEVEVRSASPGAGVARRQRILGLDPIGGLLVEDGSGRTETLLSAELSLR
jgi:BirA family biotin operon repressor/biotin-[acetyl-CoA-carboxylase] ligase